MSRHTPATAEAICFLSIAAHEGKLRKKPRVVIFCRRLGLASELTRQLGEAKGGLHIPWHAIRSPRYARRTGRPERCAPGVILLIAPPGSASLA